VSRMNGDGFVAVRAEGLMGTFLLSEDGVTPTPLEDWAADRGMGLRWSTAAVPSSGSYGMSLGGRTGPSIDDRQLYDDWWWDHIGPRDRFLLWVASGHDDYGSLVGS